MFFQMFPNTYIRCQILPKLLFESCFLLPNTFVCSQKPEFAFNSSCFLRNTTYQMDTGAGGGQNASASSFSPWNVGCTGARASSPRRAVGFFEQPTPPIIIVEQLSSELQTILHLFWLLSRRTVFFGHMMHARVVGVGPLGFIFGAAFMDSAINFDDAGSFNTSRDYGTQVFSCRRVHSEETVDLGWTVYINSRKVL